VKAVCSLTSGVILDLRLEILKLDQVQSLLAFDPQKRENHPTGSGGVLRGNGPILLEPMFWTIFVNDSHGAVVAAENTVQKLDGLRFAHLDSEERSICQASAALVDSNRSLSINYSCCVRQIGFGHLAKFSLSVGFFPQNLFSLALLPTGSGVFRGFRMPFSPTFVSFVSSLPEFFWSKLKAGHLISLTDRWFRLMRCANTASAFSDYTTVMAAGGTVAL